MVLVPILSLGTQYVSDFVSDDSTGVPAIPLELVLCNPENKGCGLLQLRHTTSPDLLYRHYWYRSIVNGTMQIALRDVAENAQAIVQLRPGDIVIDIGCNDGTLLRSYGSSEIKLVGFEPARNLITQAEMDTTKIFNAFFNAGDFLSEFKDPAKVITSIAMFYDLEDPNTFVGDVASCLDDEGIWIIQMAYLPDMLEDNMFDNICHEHLEYYSLRTLHWLLKRHNLEVFDVELNDVNGGSIRAYIRHSGARVGTGQFGIARVSALETYEQQLDLDGPQIYEEFAGRTRHIARRVRDFIVGETARDKSVYAYGASTKGNTLLQYCGLDHKLITAAADRNPDKWGTSTVGTNIPIVSEEQAREARPDYFLVLPWHFLREFRTREADFLKQGGKFIVPLPRPVIIDAAGLRPL